MLIFEDSRYAVCVRGDEDGLSHKNWVPIRYNTWVIFIILNYFTRAFSNNSNLRADRAAYSSFLIVRPNRLFFLLTLHRPIESQPSAYNYHYRTERGAHQTSYPVGQIKIRVNELICSEQNFENRQRQDE